MPHLAAVVLVWIAGFEAVQLIWAGGLTQWVFPNPIAYFAQALPGSSSWLVVGCLLSADVIVAALLLRARTWPPRSQAVLMVSTLIAGPLLLLIGFAWGALIFLDFLRNVVGIQGL